MLQRLLPPATPRNLLPVFAARALRGFADGFVAVLLPLYLVTRGFGAAEVGALATATLLGSASATLAVGAWGHRFDSRSLMRAAAVLMAATGLGFAWITGFGPLLLLAFVGTLNPSSGDVSVFLPLEHARLAEGQSQQRTELFARYALTGALCAAMGALAAGLPERLVQALGMTPLQSLQAMFVLYGLLGLAVWWAYRGLPAGQGARERAAPLGPASRPAVLRLAALFCLDSFAGGLVVNALLALWLFQRFQLSPAAAGAFFFGAGLLAAFSQLAAPALARRIGLVNTMVFTHIPASLCLIAAAFAPQREMALCLLLLRALVSSMDVPARSAFVMSVVQPQERAAAASFTAVPRSLAAALSPVLAGWLFQAGWLATPLVACGLLKISYDLALWRAFRHVQPSA